jgi:hypothetical protein
MIPERLKVPAYKQQIDFVPALGLEEGELGVNGIEFAVAASFDRDLFD